MIEDKIRVFSELWDEYEKLFETAIEEEKSSIRSEISVLERIIFDLQWCEMSGEEKQARRKAMLSLSDKWASQDEIKIEFTYEQAVVDFYDLVDSLLQEVAQMRQSNDLKCLSAMLLAEQYLVNSVGKFDLIVHNDYYVFTNLLQVLTKNDAYKKLRLSHVHDKFREMYSFWRARPYKEIL